MLSHHEIAIQFKVKVQLVRDLTKSLKKGQTLFINKRKAELLKKKKHGAIVSAIENRLHSQLSIWSAAEIAEQIRRSQNLKVSRNMVRLSLIPFVYYKGANTHLRVLITIYVIKSG